MFTKEDLRQFKSKNISVKEAESQIDRFKNGFAPVKVVRPAVIKDGIKRINDAELQKYSKAYAKSLQSGVKVSKFVPASGAATRMFKELFVYNENPEPFKNLIHNSLIVNVIQLLPRFAFYTMVKDVISSYNLDNLHVRKSRAPEIINAILSPDGLNYGALPKGLVHFHKYPGKSRTAMEEHLIEGLHYAKNSDAMVKIHFTVSPEHKTLFTEKLYSEGPVIENFNEVGLDVSFSFQKPHTDTIAVDQSNNPFRDENGELVFRPGGHGALIENLNEIDADIIFIKNIDNVVPEHLLEITVKYKNAIGGILIGLRDEIHSLLEKLDNGENNELLTEIEKFINKELNTKLPVGFDKKTPGEKADYLRKFLNRPIRVCGMVKNEGEPGGGPFWVLDGNKQESLQILESSQINLKDKFQEAQFKASTHFNPVDLVCCPKNYKGKKFDLTKYCDPETGFISEKSVNGKPIKALELPGLWNGAMANWITVFVEVPIETFNPVKTILDLLRPQHQPAN